jgi:7-carboxy-7-deazaguanine synthase
MTADEIVREILQFSGFKTSAQWVCITGGEPMIQQDLGQVIHAIKAKGLLVSLETNGTLYDEDALWEFDFLSISPKLPSMMTRTGPNIAALQLLVKLGLPMQLKFVVESGPDISMIKKVLQEVKPGCPIVFQPNGMVSPEKYLDELRWLWKTIQDPEWYGRDIRLIPQLHVMLFQHQRSI